MGVEHPNTPTEQDALPRIEVGLLGLTKILAKILASRREISLATKPHTHTQTHIQESAQQRETRKENREK